MKITDNRGDVRVQFKDLFYGDVFEDSEANICIRMATLCNEFGSWNAMRLDGDVLCFNEKDEVVKLNAELIIS